jgi:hypothetical protein
VSLFGGMSNELLEIISHSGVHDVEEIFSLREPSLGQFIREMPHEVGILLEMRPQLCD